MDGSVGEAGRSLMTGGLDKLAAPGRHTRRPGRAGLRRARLRHMSVAALVMLVLQYGLGIILNLYVEVPAVRRARRDHHRDRHRAPLALTAHAILGIALIGTAILLVARAVGVRDRLLAVLATAGLTAIGGAFGAGEIFVRERPGQRLDGDGHPDRDGAAVLHRHADAGHRGRAGGQRAAAGPGSAPRFTPRCRPPCRRPGPRTGRTTRPNGPSPRARPRAPGSSGSKRRARG